MNKRIRFASPTALALQYKKGQQVSPFGCMPELNHWLDGMLEASIQLEGEPNGERIRRVIKVMALFARVITPLLMTYFFVWETSFPFYITPYLDMIVEGIDIPEIHRDVGESSQAVTRTVEEVRRESVKYRMGGAAIHLIITLYALALVHPMGVN